MNELANERRDGQECDCKDNWHNAGRNKFDWHDGLDAAIGAVAMDALCVVNRDNALRFVDFYENVENCDHANSAGEQDPEDSWVDWKIKPTKEAERALARIKELGAKLCNGAWKTRNDTTENNGRNTVADALLSNELA